MVQRSFTGVYYHTIDHKGRLFIPAAWRSEETGSVAVLWTSFENERVVCVMFCSASELRGMTSEVDHIELTEVCLKDGMLQLITPLLEQIGERSVVLAGVGSSFEIWPLSLWESVEEDISEEQKEFIKKLTESII